MKKSLIISILMLMSFSFISNAFSQESIKIGSMDKYPPYNFKGKGGKYIGIDVAIIEAVLNELGIKAIHVPTPWKRALVDFETGKTDMLFQLAPKPERFEKWNMVGPLRDNNRAYFVKNDSKIVDIKSIKELKGLKVGTIRGYVYPDEFMQADYFKKQEVTNIKQNVIKLSKGRIDIVVENEYPFKYELNKLRIEHGIRMLPTFASKHVRYAAFHKDKKGNELSKIFQKNLDELISSGMIKSIIDNWREH